MDDIDIHMESWRIYDERSTSILKDFLEDT